MTCFHKIGAQWKEGAHWSKDNGVWRRVQVWQNVGGVWKLLDTSFQPNGGDVRGEGNGDAYVTLRCNKPAQWTYTPSSASGTDGLPSDCYYDISLNSGGISNQIVFHVHAPAVVAGNQYSTGKSWGVVGVSDGLQRNFAVSIVVGTTLLA